MQSARSTIHFMLLIPSSYTSNASHTLPGPLQDQVQQAGSFTHSLSPCLAASSTFPSSSTSHHIRQAVCYVSGFVAWCEQLMPLWRVTHQASSMTPSGRALCCFSTLMASSTFPPRASGDSSRSSSSLLSISNSIPAQEQWRLE